MKPKTKKIVVMISVIILLFAVYLFYSRPMTIQQRYLMLTLDRCVEITAYYEIGMQEEPTQVVIEKDSEVFEELSNKFYLKNYCRSLKDILPRGTRTHRTEEDDYQWDVYFVFEDVPLADGSIGSGGMLRIQCWYGELDIHFDGEMLSCYTNEQEAWTKEVLNIIQSVK